MRARVGMLAALLLCSCDAELHFDDGQDAGGADSGADAAAATCTNDQSCGHPQLHCSVEVQMCFECFRDEQCTRAGLGHCHRILHRCVECGMPEDCTGGDICERRAHVCLPSCRDENDCALSYAGCDPMRHVCVSCLFDDDCAQDPSGHFCDHDTGRCVQCRDDQSCGGGLRCDPLGRRCVQCLLSTDCPGSAPVCDPESLSCVEPS